MAQNTEKRAADGDSRTSAHSARRGANSRGGVRTLIAALRVTDVDLQLLDAVRPLLAEIDTAGELAYRVWRRGLESLLAEVAAVGGALPAGFTDAQIAILAAQRLVAVLPLLQRTDKLALLQLQGHRIDSVPEPMPPMAWEEGIDTTATETILLLGGNEFL